MAGERVGLYLRLSRDDERLGESMSIENQRDYLTQYLRQRGWQAAGIYADDGYSGLHFNRPAFQRLLGDIEAGAINLVVTKDLSRLGRDQIGTAYYYQIYFPRHQVRYIAATEGFDTAGTGAADALFPFLTAANDFYTADISRKVRAALTARKREGKFIGAAPPLGYRKDPERRGHLVEDPRGAALVRRAFSLYLALGSVAGTARALTLEGYPTPAQYRRGEGGAGRFPGVWSDTMVRRILTNPTYAGHLTQNRREKVNYKVERRVTLPPSAWITVPNTHQPLVSQAQFDAVQALLRARSYTPRTGGPHLLTGLVFCGGCGSPMTYQGDRLVCQGYRRGGRLGLCTPHRVAEGQVVQALRTQLVRLARPLAPQLTAALTPTASPPRRAPEESPGRQAALLDRLYQDWADGLLEEEELRALLARRQMGQEPPHPPTPGPMPEDPVTRVEALLAFSPLSRGVLVALVERVLVRDDGDLEVYFRFSQPGPTSHFHNRRGGP